MSRRAFFLTFTLILPTLPTYSLRARFHFNDLPKEFMDKADKMRWDFGELPKIN